MNKPTTDELKVEQTHPETYQTLEEVVRAGAKKMLIAALEAEVEAYIQSHQGERDKKGHALVVRNGHSQERTIQCGAGLAMAFKLLLQAEERWRRVNSPHLVALVQAGVKFPDGETKVLPDMPAQDNSDVVNVHEDAAFV